MQCLRFQGNLIGNYLTFIKRNKIGDQFCYSDLFIAHEKHISCKQNEWTRNIYPPTNIKSKCTKTIWTKYLQLKHNSVLIDETLFQNLVKNNEIKTLVYNRGGHTRYFDL